MNLVYFVTPIVLFRTFSSQCESLQGNQSVVSTTEESSPEDVFLRDQQERAEGMCREADALRQRADDLREQADELCRQADMILYTANTLPPGEEDTRHPREYDAIDREANDLFARADDLRHTAVDEERRADKLHEDAVDLLQRAKHDCGIGS